MVTSIAELSPAGLELYPGDYDDYLTQREARQALVEARARNQAKRVAEIERFIERFRYKSSKARQVQSRIKMLDRLDRVEVEGAARQIRFSFPAPPRTGRHVVQLRRIAKAYGPKVVYTGIDLDLERGDRIALVGPNGAGKSTLLRILAGGLSPDSGERVLGAHVTTHYYAQHQLDALDPTRTVLEEMVAAAPEADRTRLRSLLGAFLFSGDAVEKRVSVLSGGEKARLPSPACSCAPRPSCVSTNRRTISTSLRGTCSRTRWRPSLARWCSSRTTATSSIAWRRRSSRSGTATSRCTSAGTTTTKPHGRAFRWARRPRRRRLPRPRPRGTPPAGPGRRRPGGVHAPGRPGAPATPRRSRRA
jgi:hypothetical protein